MAQTLSLHEANQAVPGWRALASGLHITVATDDFAAALALVDRIGAIAEEQQHHPNIDLRWGRVHVVTSSHDAGGITDRDLRLATACMVVAGLVLASTGKKYWRAAAIQLVPAALALVLVLLV